MDYRELTNHLVSWIQNKVEEANAKGAVVGLSGGIDSAVVMALCREAYPNNCLGVIMPCLSSEEDINDAKLVGEHLKVPYKVVDLTETYQTLLSAVGLSSYAEMPRMALANIKPRLRMTVLYFEAAVRNYLVVGTGNKSELAIGYFTKYGDGGVDIEPIGNLLKTQVIELARYLNIPEKIITKAPTAGLWEGQTDEQEMGFTYQELDKYLLGQTIDQQVKVKIERLHKASEHKRKMPPIAPIPY